MVIALMAIKRNTSSISCFHPAIANESMVVDESVVVVGFIVVDVVKVSKSVLETCKFALGILQVCFFVLPGYVTLPICALHSEGI